MTVVDASVAVKWLLPEPGSDEAQGLLESGEALWAPALIAVEVAAALARKSRLKEVQPSDAELALGLWTKSLASGVLGLVSDQADLRQAFRFAAELAHPLQDCLYLALAERLEATFVTADARFSGKARQLYPNVQLLAARAGS